MDIKFDDLKIRGFEEGAAKEMVEIIRELEQTNGIARLPFKPEWFGETFRFDGFNKGKHAMFAGVGKVFYFHTGHASNLLGIIVGTRFGNVIFYSRFNDGSEGFVLANVPKELSGLGLIANYEISADQLREYVKSTHPDLPGNIGHRIERFVRQVSKTLKVKSKTVIVK